MWPTLVVVVAEAVELELQVAQGPSRDLVSEVELERLVQALDLPAGLRVVGP